MTAVIYARYSSDNQREDPLKADSRVYGLCGKERHHHRQALH